MAQAVEILTPDGPERRHDRPGGQVFSLHPELALRSPITVCKAVPETQKKCPSGSLPYQNYNLISRRDVLLLSQPRYTVDKET